MRRIIPALAVVCVTFAWSGPAMANPYGRNPAAMKRMQQEMMYRQQEMQRYQTAMAAKEREIYLSYDENGNGKLEAAEMAKFRKYMTAVQNGKEANPFASIPLPGTGPRPK